MRTPVLCGKGTKPEDARQKWNRYDDFHYRDSE